VNAHTIKIESDEDGFWLVLEVDEADPLRVRIEDPEALYDTVKAEIGPWLYERDRAFAEFRAAAKGGIGQVVQLFRCNPDESAGLDEDAYDPNDPKHPRYHSTHADIWDAREKGLS
jgi:hypothetical protein